MIFAWIGFLISILVLSLLKPLIYDFEVVVMIIISINIPLVVFAISSEFKKGLRELILFAYFIRIATMLWDIYAKKIYMLPHSGRDTEGFFKSAELISNNITLINEPIYGGVYSKFLGVLFYISHSERLLGQYINVLLGITIIIIIYKILRLLKINNKVLNISILLIAFFPHAIIFSGILLRENIICMFVVTSLYFFVKWYINGYIKNFFLSLLCIVAASIFHSGTIVISIGYLFMFMFFKHKKNKFVFDIKSILFFLSFIFITWTLFVFTHVDDFIFYKFDKVNEINDLYDVASSRAGGSAYLNGLTINSLWELIAYAPIYMFYFLTSPLPMNWRGLNDILSFFMDGLIYFMLISYSLLNLNRINIKEKPIIFGILIMLLITVFVFGIGVQNAGTALRHRHKLLPIFIMFFAIIADSKMNLKERILLIYSREKREIK